MYSCPPSALTKPPSSLQSHLVQRSHLLVTDGCCDCRTHYFIKCGFASFIVRVEGNDSAVLLLFCRGPVCVLAASD